LIQLSVKFEIRSKTESV